MINGTFNNKNLYIYLIELGFSLLFLIMFCCIHYGITNATKWGKKVQKSKIFNFWYFFIFGLTLSSLTFIVSQVSSIAIGEIGMPLTILGLIYAMTIFYNRSVQIGAIIPTILWILYQYNGFTKFGVEWLSRLIIVLVISICAIATTFIKWKKWPTFLLSCLVTFALIIVCIVLSTKTNIAFYSITALLSIISTIFYYAVIGFINRWLMHLSKMAKQGAYIDKHYLIPTVLEQYFFEFINKHNVQQALILLFRINEQNTKNNKFLDNIYELFKNENCLFFKSKYDSYGVILTGPKYNVLNLNRSFLGNNMLIRKKNDDLKILEQELMSLKHSNENVIFYVSVYGVHSCSLDSLIWNNEYAIKQNFNNKNIIHLFNTNIRNREIQDNIAYSTLVQKVNLNDIDVELELVEIGKSHRQYILPRFYWPKKLTCNFDEILKQFDVSTSDTLVRALATKTIEQYINKPELSQYKLLIYYPIRILNTNEWNIYDLVQKIKLFGINIKQIILLFDLNNISTLTWRINNNLKALEKNKIAYFVTNVNSPKVIKNISPSCAIYKNNRYNKNI